LDDKVVLCFYPIVAYVSVARVLPYGECAPLVLLLGNNLQRLGTVGYVLRPVYTHGGYIRRRIQATPVVVRPQMRTVRLRLPLVDPVTSADVVDNFYLLTGSVFVE
jgi:hypothetical protein